MLSEVGNTVSVRHTHTNPTTNDDNANSVRVANILTLVVDIQNLVLEYLHSADQLALTTTCRQWSSLRSDATSWKMNLQLKLTPRTEKELAQSIECLQFESEPTMNAPVALNLSHLSVTDEILQQIASSLSFASKVESTTLDITAVSLIGFDSFQHLPKLTQLNLTQYNLHSLESLHTSMRLRSLTTINFCAIRSLDLSFTSIGAVGAQVRDSETPMSSLRTIDCPL